MDTKMLSNASHIYLSVLRKALREASHILVQIREVKMGQMGGEKNSLKTASKQPPIGH